MSITAKVKLSRKGESADGQTYLEFHPDYADGRNKEWAKYTPSMSVQMTVLDEVAEKFEPQGAYTLTFTPSED
jgi:hypothetical protein